MNIPDQEPGIGVGSVTEMGCKLLGKSICCGFRLGESFVAKGNWLIWRYRRGLARN